MFAQTFPYLFAHNVAMCNKCPPPPIPLPINFEPKPITTTHILDPFMAPTTKSTMNFFSFVAMAFWVIHFNLLNLV